VVRKNIMVVFACDLAKLCVMAGRREGKRGRE
jgi:hypothetical protein